MPFGLWVQAPTNSVPFPAGITNVEVGNLHKAPSNARQCLQTHAEVRQRNLTLQRSSLPPPKARKGICRLHNHLGEFGGPSPTSATPPVQSQPKGERDTDRTGSLRWHKKWFFGCWDSIFYLFSVFIQSQIVCQCRSHNGTSPCRPGHLPPF